MERRKNLTMAGTSSAGGSVTCAKIFFAARRSKRNAALERGAYFAGAASRTAHPNDTSRAFMSLMFSGTLTRVPKRHLDGAMLVA
jgi:hypothetical protein